MVIHMKTTFNIDDALMQQLREEAAKRNTTMTSIVEAGIRHMISAKKEPKEVQEKPFKLPSWPMGTARVDIANRDELYRLFDEEKPPWS